MTAPEGLPRLPERLLVGVTGSIAALGLPGYLNAFRALGANRVTVVPTRNARRFLSAETLGWLSNAVCTDEDHGPGHVALAEWAELMLVLPATANVLGAAANGLAPDLLTTVLLARQRPVVFAPAMNKRMWDSPAVRRNVRTLRADGHTVVAPEEGPVYEAASRQLVTGLVLPRPERIAAVLAERG
ncbi:phosphopantothenoylcysteine decarboxylase/phosphopantothenate--cysteine ligase [Crossiella equi]|uniref:Phosphopantothenoylcysteine decarboxylase/phosphopantothenate--cysteine ligase n=1 Tax=Crossiella equi TaxID=130796 RepID=A0ABS5ACB9_9PSEU|nr:flavoprotein [Crossiella equi]MBP2473991.1 phosphopantothenoylcysteine decarboxylase/phosphopantothenate--cysteine ligase [Crossiella equi]